MKTMKTKKATLRIVPVLERFSEDQLVTLRRLQKAMEAKTLNVVVYQLAQAGLWVLGLDPVAREAFDRLSTLIYGGANGGTEPANEIVNVVINGPAEAGQHWIGLQRRAEFGARAAVR